MVLTESAPNKLKDGAVGVCNTFELSQFDVGDILGQGAFGAAYAISWAGSGGGAAGYARENTRQLKRSRTLLGKLKELKNDTTSFQDISTGTATSLTPQENVLNLTAGSQSVKSDFGPEDEFSMKILRSKDPAMCDKAMRDLRSEVSILSNLPYQHPHIIKLHGVSKGLFAGRADSFLVMEKLHETLDKALRRWQQDANERTLFLKKKTLTIESQSHRIQKVALGLSAALKFLHKNKIIYRDLKPANIGFDRKGSVKLFDFGCARVMDNSNSLHRAGTLRYMAPENASRRSYGLPSDVYSFGLVLWEVCTLTKPHDKAESKRVLNAMVKDGIRPSLRKVASSRIRELLTACWDSPEERPKFTRIHTVIKKEVAAHHQVQRVNADL